MKFTNASAIESVVWQMRLADYPRGMRRSKIDELANGFPPYTEQEVRDEGIDVNTSSLSLCKILHDARRQFSIAHLTPDPLFTITLDYGPVWRRQKWQATITKNLNRMVKESLPYLEARRSVFANVVRQGPGPMVWEDSDFALPEAVAIEDVLIPSSTLLTMKNLPFYALYRKYTSHELDRLTRGTKVDPAWNMPLVQSCKEWVDNQSRTLMGASWPEVWAPEKMSERIKEDGGLYASDAVPTINCFDFRFWDEDENGCGWKRRLILDPWGMPGPGGVGSSESRKYNFGKGEFLYDSGNRVFADKLGEMIHFQFADASAVAPFRYHSVRSLGFLLYSVCHLQDRMQCRFNEATFESLMQYFRVSNPSDMDRPGHIKLINKGVIREGVNFVPRNDRWQVDRQLAGEAMQLNRQIMADNSASFTQDFDLGESQSSNGETATRTNAKLNASAAMVGAMLAQSYEYAVFEKREICRRACRQNSRDMAVREFRKRCLTGEDRVPEEALNVECWDVKCNRVLGGGNKSVQIAIADKLWAMRPVLSPESQKQVDRIYIAANSDDYALADALVKEAPTVTNTVHDTQNVFGSLMAGAYVEPAPGVNPIEVVETMLKQMEIRIGEIMQSGGVGTPQDVSGLTKASQYTTAFIQQLSQIKDEQERVAAYGKSLGKMMNEVKAFGQRQAQRQGPKESVEINYKDAPPDIQRQIEQAAGFQPSQAGNGHEDALNLMTKAADAKLKLTTKAADARLKMVTKEAQGRQGLLHKEAAFQQKMKHEEIQHRTDLAHQGLETANDISMSRMKAENEPKTNGE